MKIEFEIGAKQAEALAQVLKRIGFSEVRKLSTTEAETYDAQAALETIRKALNNAGFNPR